MMKKEKHNEANMRRVFNHGIASVWFFVGALLLLSCGAQTSSPAPPVVLAEPPTLVVRNVTIINVDQPKVATHQSVQSVHIRGEQISWVGPLASEPDAADANVIDGTGAYLVAGLSEMHAHFPGDDDPVSIDAYLHNLLKAGVTSVRSMRGDPSHQALRDSIRAGNRVGPDLMLASTPASSKALNREQANEFVATAKREGADFIKILGIRDLESYQHLVSAAAEYGLYVAGHLPPFISVQEASEAGQKSVEHLGGVLQPLMESKEAGKAAVKQAAAAPMVHCPTLFWYAVQRGVFRPQDLADFEASALVSQEEQGKWDAELAKKRSDATIDGPALERMADRFEAVRLLDHAGATFVIGADASGIYAIPGPAYHRELALLAKAGLDSITLLRAATINAAALRGVESTEGTIAVGKLANLVLVGADPVADIENLRDVRAVIHRGRSIELGTSSASEQ